MKKIQILTLLLCLFVAASVTADIIADSVADLTWTDSGGAVSSITGDTMTITAAKSSDVTAGFSALTLPNAGDYLTVQFDLVRDGPAMLDDASTFEIWFDGSYGYAVAFEPYGGASQAIFRETDDNNLGKFNSFAIGSNTTQSVSFTLTRIATGNGLDLTAAGGLVDNTGNTITREADLAYKTSTTFSQIYFKFLGSGWLDKNQDLSISNFSVTTSVPEPATIGMLGFGALVALLARRFRC